MSERGEERAVRLYTAEIMKNARAKETEEQAALRRMQEAQRMARHRAKKKRCLDENLAREISKIAELSKMPPPDPATIAQMSEINMNKISAELKQMMERGKVPEHIVQMAQLAEFSKMNSELNKMSQDMAKRYEMEKMAEYAKTTEYMKMQEIAKMNEMVKFSEMAKYNDIKINEMAKMNEMMKMSQMAKINEVQRINELAKLNEMVKMTEMAKYTSNDITKLNEIAQISEMAKEIAKMNEKTKMSEMMKMQTSMQNDIAKMSPEYSKMANEMAKLTELAKLNEITITKLNDPPQVLSKMSEIQPPPPPPPPRIPEPVITVPNPRNLQNVQTVQVAQASPSSMINFPSVPGQNNYGKLLMIIEELGRDIRLSYAGSRSAAERLKNGIQQARVAVRDCLMETQHNAQQ
ncbi:uncharacterized protein LOC114938376 isoform X1 [Nylanderia fulva]|uniref:uncharacterized protein LOC114938376 isoform X1 n=2 Tax=Nylanderia fulva TaxID=613905 RepID=UPI0010FB8B35|nr:uncharacterized protein LOC114938376 isoform X1 [Nylanderia fulva]XP_029168176.1 uncharacterized protein LOC114938376 isoform X1 [Nylanderia fulva]XP_029168185.1 uncharacterized protein LOC114938376 isoform X1 [Nylanderia fulva]